jgi:hypothetical protein
MKVAHLEPGDVHDVLRPLLLILRRFRLRNLGTPREGVSLVNYCVRSISSDQVAQSLIQILADRGAKICEDDVALARQLGRAQLADSIQSLVH